MSLFQKGYQGFSTELKKLKELFGRPLILLIAYSGGSDSSLLLAYISEYILLNPRDITRVIVLHINEGLSNIFPEISQSEEQEKELFLKQSTRYPFVFEYVSSQDSFSFKKYESYEDAMHIMRKKIFMEYAQKYAADKIITGHHQDDQIEHFLIGIIRNSSTKRISGMEISSGLFFRPLLLLNKKEILTAIQEKSIKHLIDPTNSYTFSLRNKVRNTLLPLLDEVDSRSRKNILSFMKKLKSQESFIRERRDDYLKIVCLNVNSFDKEAFLAIPLLMQKEVLAYLFRKASPSSVFTEGICQEILKFLSSSKSKMHSIKRVLIKKEKKTVTILPLYPHSVIQ